VNYYSQNSIFNILHLASMLKDKLARAEMGFRKSLTALAQLSTGSEEAIDDWIALEANALEKGGEEMSIYDVSLADGLLLLLIYIFSDSCFTYIAPSQSEICKKLTDEARKKGNSSETVKWLAEGIHLEEMQ
jgi:hypothetical protein